MPQNMHMFLFCFVVVVILFCIDPPIRLIQWGQDKMGATLQATFSNAFWLINSFVNCVHMGFNSQQLSIGQRMVWRRIGNKPLSVPMMAKFINGYTRHSGSMVYLLILFRVFTGTGSIAWLSQCPWSYVEGDGWIAWSHNRAQPVYIT